MYERERERKKEEKEKKKKDTKKMINTQEGSIADNMFGNMKQQMLLHTARYKVLFLVLGLRIRRKQTKKKIAQ